MDYSSNIDLTDGRIQTVYASQLYGTFFGIFAKFDCSPTQIVGTKKTRRIKSMEFNLINYKGYINLEIIDLGNVRQIDTGLGFSGLAIDVHVKHTANSKSLQLSNPTNSSILSLDLTQLTNYKVQDNTDSEYFFHPSGVEVTSGEDYLRLERKLDPMKTIPLNSNQIADGSIMNGVFDSEFYERDGNFVIQKNVFDFTNPTDTGKYAPTLTSYPSTSCPPSNSKIYFE